MARLPALPCTCRLAPALLRLRAARRARVLRALVAAAGLASPLAHADPSPDWQAQAHALAALAAPAQLRAVTDYVHLRVRFRPDLDDHWQTPMETLRSGEGDCEDFALAKFALLRAAGWPRERLRLAYGRTWAFGLPQPHLVALAWDEAEDDPLVLDNLGDTPTRLSERRDLELLVSFDERHYWQGASAQRLPVASPLGQWRRVAARMDREGTLFAVHTSSWQRMPGRRP